MVKVENKLDAPGNAMENLENVTAFEKAGEWAGRKVNGRSQSQ